MGMEVLNDEKIIDEQAQIIETDVNIFNVRGKLLISFSLLEFTIFDFETFLN